MEFTTDNPRTSNVAIAPFTQHGTVLPCVASWNGVSMPQAGSRTADRTRVVPTGVRTAENSIASTYANVAAVNVAAVNVAALAKQGAPPRGEPR